MLRSPLLKFKSFYAGAAASEFDVIVIGGGPGGYVAAIKAAQLGFKTACVEKRGALGGTCLNVGCIPSKALLHSSHLYSMVKDGSNEMSKRGIVISKNSTSLDLAAMMAHKEKSVVNLTKGIEGLFKKNNVSYIKGFASFASSSPNEIQISLSDSKVEKIRGKNIIIATGSEAVVAMRGLSAPQVDETTMISSTGALSLPSVPKKLLVIGGGVIGLELGSVWSRLGSEVTVVEYEKHIGGMGIDLGLSAAYHRILQKQGMNFKLGSKVTAVTKSTTNSLPYSVNIEGTSKETLNADVVLMSVGRKPFTAGLNLDKVGIKTDEKGRIVTNPKNYSTNVPGVYAIGDVISGPMLAHKAEEEGIAVAEILATGHGHVNYENIPSVIYTFPEVAWTGATEEDLKAKKIPYSIGNFPFLANSRAKSNDEGTEGFVKILSHSETDRLLGVHVIGPNAGEMISEAVLAMEYGASSEDIARTCHAHPTLSEALKEACLAAHGQKKAIHF